MSPSPIIVGIGEILWDLLPSGRQLGGAPANFAYCSHLLGNWAIVVSRVGSDSLGGEVREHLRVSGLSDEYVQTDSAHPTGTVSVRLDSAGKPEFEITSTAAWDFLEWNAELGQLAQSCHAVCFGTLAQRSEQSRRTIFKFLEATERKCLRVFDVNLRQSFFSAEVLTESLSRASAMKLNHEELLVVAGLLEMATNNFVARALEKFNLQFVCVTRGEKGSVLFGRGTAHEHPGFHVEVKDTVGAGDAFTAGLVHEYLRGASLSQMNNTANRMGAWVASCSGGMPEAPEELESVLPCQNRVKAEIR